MRASRRGGTIARRGVPVLRLAVVFAGLSFAICAAFPAAAGRRSD